MAGDATGGTHDATKARVLGMAVGRPVGDLVEEYRAAIGTGYEEAVWEVLGLLEEWLLRNADAIAEGEAKHSRAPLATAEGVGGAGGGKPAGRLGPGCGPTNGGVSNG